MVTDNQILNAFWDASESQRPAAQTYNDSPVLPTAAGGPTYNQFQSYSNVPQQAHSPSSAVSVDHLASLINAQNSRIDQIVNAVNHLAQQYVPTSVKPANVQNYSYKTPVATFTDDIPIDDGTDVTNVWNLVDRATDTESDSIKEKIIQRTKSLGLTDSLPQSALDWANQKGISLKSVDHSFTTSVNLSDSDRKLVESALSFMDSLSSANDVFCVYKLVKSNLNSRLSGPDLNILMSDFSAYQVRLSQPRLEQQTKPETPLDAKPSVDVATQQDAFGQLLDSSEVETLLEESESRSTLPLSFAEVDESLWSIAQSVAKRRFGGDVTDAQVSPIYELLANASGTNRQATPTVFAKFSDQSLLNAAITDSKSKFHASWPSVQGAAYVLKTYRDAYLEKYSDGISSAFVGDAHPSALVDELFCEFTKTT